MKSTFKIYSLVFLLVWINNICAQENFVIGEYKISKIVDGDTFKFEKLDKSARLIGVDAEETFKDADAESKSKELEANWLDKYQAEKTKEQKPAKTNSPFGYSTWLWTKEIFKDVKYVRLEKDDENRTLDVYGRYLVYVIAIRNDGTEFNYNLECVRQGYSPYFCKYGYSYRFDKEFRDAEQYAVNNSLGIWGKGKFCYPDYSERIMWWDNRAESIKHFQQIYSRNENYFSFADGTNLEKLQSHINDTITIFGCSEEILTDHEPYLVKIKYNNEIGIDIIIFSEYVSLLQETGIGDEKNYYLYIRGQLKTYNGNYEIILTDKSQVWQE